MFNPNRILVLAPHTDDGELGCGGTIAKYCAEGKEVFYAAFSDCQKSLAAGLAPDTLKNECKNATELLGSKKPILFFLILM
jgi:LmbE family N-acetylglucosaminyl deacetylase